MATTRPAVAILPWGLLLEDFLDPNGLTLEAFCTDFTGSWIFNYADALRTAGVRSVIFGFSARVPEVVRRTHRASGHELCLIPAPAGYRRLRRRMAAPYGRSALETFGERAGGGPARPLLAAAGELAPYLATPVAALGRELRGHGCRAVVCQEYEFPRFDVCVALGRRLGIPVFASFQGGDYRRWRLERVIRPVAVRGAAGLIVASAAERARVRTLYGRVPVHDIPNPIDLGVWHPHDRDAARRRAGIPAGARVAAWHGRVELHKKGLDRLLDAWRALPGGEYVLLLIGDGGDAPELGRRLASAVPGSYLWVDRHLHDPAEIAELLSAADLYVFPSRHEGFALAPLEAMACGLPVLATEVSGIRELLGSGTEPGGVIVAQDDAERLAAELGSLLGDPSRTAALGERAAARAQAFGLETVGERLRAVLLG